MKNFVHLHVHDTGSFLDGMCKIPDLIKRTKELGMTAIAETNHNHIGLCYEFQKQCKAQGIKPILGGELYYTWDTNIASLPIEDRRKTAFEAMMKDIMEEEKAEIDKIVAKSGLSDKTIKKIFKDNKKLKQYEYDIKQYHILFLAMNQKGWNNLVKLQSEAALKCTYNGRFLCDTEMIRKYNEGLIMTVACIGSAPASLIIDKKEDEAKKLIQEWHDIFQDRFYLEIQPLNIDKQRKVNHAYFRWSKELDIKTVATNDVHYILKEDHEDHDTLLCIGTGSFKSTPNRMRYSNDFWLKTLDEMSEGFAEQAFSMTEEELLKDENEVNEYIKFCTEALDETNKVADRVSEDIQISSGTYLFPKIKIPGGITPEDYLALKSYKGLYDYYKKTPDIDLALYEKQLSKELDIIIKKGFASYMLIVAEYIEWAGKQGIMIGPGRGSAAGSLILFCLGITKMVDPIKYNLLFSRFLTMDRTGMPDIDVDVDYYGRPDVLKHLEDYYGKKNVCHIGTYTIMGVKSGLKDVGRVLAIDFDTMNKISKEIDSIMDKPQPKFSDFDNLQNGDENDKVAYKRFSQLEEANKEIFRLARKFEGTHRGFGVHASGILVMPCEVTDYFPIRVANDGSVTALFTGVELDECGSVKLDVLGLKNLSLIQNVLNHIGLSLEEFYEKVDIADPAIYELVRERKTDGIFQLESDLFKATIKEMQPTEIHDIIALTALCRPGPLSAKMHLMYAHRKNGIEDISYPIRGCESFLKQTYGVICYQEQLMQVSKTVSGFDDGQADSLTRKVTAKKRLDQMEMLRRCHFYGKRNCEGPEGWEDDANAPWYDPKAKYGREICGAVVNGYTVEEMDSYWQSILGFASYAFNLSHASTYSYISVLELWLKKYYPVEYMAALLSIQDNEESRSKYINICRKMGIKIKCPDINISENTFTPNKDSILYSLNSIKNVGEKALEQIFANKPYSSLKDLLEKIPKKVLNKRVVENLIKAGALDSINTNRYTLMNEFRTLRKINEEPLEESLYIPDICDKYEEESLGVCVTNIPYWNMIRTGERVVSNGTVKSIRKHTDKKGKEMAFISVVIEKCTIRGIVFSKAYNKAKEILQEGNECLFFGNKDEKDELIISKISPAIKEVTADSSFGEDIYMMDFS